MMFTAALFRRTSNSLLECRFDRLRFSSATPSRYASGSTTTIWKGVASAIQDEVTHGKLIFDPLQQQAAKKIDENPKHSGIIQAFYV
mmetsp:Transcript_18337/g.36742  ORF Transcript_18337/g.36742 Transcript_18337/m.36742 type:complete len:87 (+) Transcript_18337:380-640(+)